MSATATQEAAAAAAAAPSDTTKQNHDRTTSRAHGCSIELVRRYARGTQQPSLHRQRGPAPHTARPPAPRLSRSSRVEPIASTAFPVPNIPRQLRHLPCPTLDALVPYRTAPRPPGHGPALASPLSHPSHTRPCVRRSPMQPNTIKTNNQHYKLAKPVRTHYYSHRILPLWSRAGLRAPRTTRCPTVGGLRAPHFPFT